MKASLITFTIITLFYFLIFAESLDLFNKYKEIFEHINKVHDQTSIYYSAGNKSCELKLKKRVYFYSDKQISPENATKTCQNKMAKVAQINEQVVTVIKESWKNIKCKSSTVLFFKQQNGELNISVVKIFPRSYKSFKKFHNKVKLFVLCEKTAEINTQHNYKTKEEEKQEIKNHSFADGVYLGAVIFCIFIVFLVSFLYYFEPARVSNLLQ